MTTDEFNNGRRHGLKEALDFLTNMERRYRQWAASNPGIDGMQESVRGKIEAVMTAKRAIENLRNQ